QAEADRKKAEAEKEAAERAEREEAAKQYEADKAAGKGDAGSDTQTEEERRAEEDARREEEDRQRDAEDRRRAKEDERRRRDEERRAAEDAQKPWSPAREKLIDKRREREDARQAKEDERRAAEDKRRAEEDERRSAEDERRDRVDAQQEDRKGREDAAAAAENRLVGLKRPQAKALAEAVQKATGLPMDQVLGILKDAIVKGKLDPAQLLGALQAAVKPLNVNGLLDELSNAAGKLGPLGKPLHNLTNGLRDQLGMGPAAARELPAALKKKIQKLLKQLKNAKKKKSEKEEKKSKAVCKIHKNGKPVPIDNDKILSVVVNQSVDMVSSFRIVVTDADLALSADKRFQEGEALSIEMGWSGGNTGFIMEGEIVSRELEFPQSGPVLLKLHGLSFDHRLNRGRFTRMWQKTPDQIQTSDDWIAKQILNDDLKGTVEAGTIEDPGVKFEYVFQNNMTNLEFLRSRAALYNYEIYVDIERKLHFRKPPVKTKAAVKLTRGKDLKHFRARMNLASQIAAVHVRGHNPKDPCKPITGKATDTDVIDKMDTVTLGTSALKKLIEKTMSSSAGLDQKKHGAVQINVKTPVIDEGHATEMAKAILNRYAFGFCSGHGSAFGNPELKAGTTVELDAIGKRFEGKYYLETTSHIFEGNGYTTMFTVHRPGITNVDKQQKPPVDPPKPPVDPETEKTFFELTVVGLKSLGFANHGAAVQRSSGKDPDDKPAAEALDGQGTIKKPDVDPGRYNVILEEILDDETDWDFGDAVG
ncbi:MAG: phage late control D family protein, partial [Planctomycetota bacterium]